MPGLIFGKNTKTLTDTTKIVNVVMYSLVIDVSHC